MDRNLGAPDVNYHGNSTGSVYYQFGRKDPFEVGTLYKPDGSSISISNIAWDATTQESSKKGKNVPYSVQNPLKFITSSSTWTTGDQYCPADGGDFMWQDPKAASSADGKVKKSIFDPCPSGWMVPVSGTLDALSMTHSNQISPIPVNGLGRYYYPNTNNKVDYICFPYGCLQPSYSSRGYYWLASTASTNAYAFDLNDNSVQPVNGTKSTPRYYGGSVRCIQEYF